MSAPEHGHGYISLACSCRGERAVQIALCGHGGRRRRGGGRRRIAAERARGVVDIVGAACARSLCPFAYRHTRRGRNGKHIVEVVYAYIGVVPVGDFHGDRVAFDLRFGDRVAFIAAGESVSCDAVQYKPLTQAGGMEADAASVRAYAFGGYGNRAHSFLYVFGNFSVIHHHALVACSHYYGASAGGHVYQSRNAGYRYGSSLYAAAERVDASGDAGKPVSAVHVAGYQNLGCKALRDGLRNLMPLRYGCGGAGIGVAHGLNLRVDRSRLAAELGAELRAARHALRRCLHVVERRRLAVGVCFVYEDVFAGHMFVETRPLNFVGKLVCKIEYLAGYRSYGIPCL